MSNSRVLSLPIVIRFDVLKDTGSCHAPSPVSLPVDKLNFQGMEKALGYSIIIAVAFVSHAATQSGVLNQPLIPF